MKLKVVHSNAPGLKVGQRVSVISHESTLHIYVGRQTQPTVVVHDAFTAYASSGDGKNATSLYIVGYMLDEIKPNGFNRVRLTLE